MLGDVQSYQQQSTFTCSAAALHAVLKHWGAVIDEPTLAGVIGANPKTGAVANQIVDAARQYGFLADMQRFESLPELHAYVGQARRQAKQPILPVIANIFSFTRPGTGHFVVITDIDTTHVTLMDPNSPSNWRRLTYPEMAARWFGRGGIGVIVQPPKRLLRAPTSLGDDAVLRADKPKNSLRAIGLVTLGWAIIVGISFWQQQSRKQQRRYRA